MIFVTVGSTIPFDELMAEVDRLAGSGAFGGEEVVCQSGHSKHRMLHCESFFGRVTLADLIERANFVVCHGGAGSVIQMMVARKRFAAFPNPRAAGDHQGRFLEHCSRIADISWSRDVTDLLPLMQARLAAEPTRIRSDIPKARDLVMAEIARIPSRRG